ncbi:MAG: metal-dependent hydrolase [Desulfobacteraceae bacterium]|nr:metal-dependent hydrolase [Desulfobacteraceae bacterium]
MADFKTHLTVSSIFSSLAAITLSTVFPASPKEVLIYFTMGLVGGILPDIDSDSSIPVRLLFTFIATIISFLIVFAQSAHSSVLALFFMWIISFIVIKVFCFSLFTRMTVHRGIIHSIPAGFFCWFLSTIILYKIFNFSNFTAWMAGLFIFTGFILHLVLDEFYSLNLFGDKVKKSLGTALKFGVAKDLKSTILMYLAVLFLFNFTPSYKPFVSAMVNGKSYATLQVFPKDHWFKKIYQKIYG